MGRPVVGDCEEAAILAEWASSNATRVWWGERSRCPNGFRKVGQGSNRILVRSKTGNYYKIDIRKSKACSIREGNRAEHRTWGILAKRVPSLVPEHHLYIFDDVAIMAVEWIPRSVPATKADEYVEAIYRAHGIALEDAGSINLDNLRQRKDGTIVLVDGGGYVTL